MEFNSITNARPITNNPYSQVAIDIIIPFKEDYIGVSDLINSINANRGINKNVILVDDNSHNKTFCNQYKNVPWINVLQLNEDKGFGYCVNHAVKESKSDICFVLHSDVSYLPINFFKEMIYLLTTGSKEKLALLSARVDKVSPKSCNWILQTDPPSSEKTYTILENEDWVPLICCAFSKNAFSKAGGLATYPYCWFEDKLLCEKLRAFGYNLGVANSVNVRHKGGVTVTKLLNKNPKILEILKKNKSLYENDSMALKNYLNSKKKS